MTHNTHPHTAPDRIVPVTHPNPTKILGMIVKRSFAALSTTSPADRPHVAGVLYAAVGTTLYVNSLSASRKVRNIEANKHVAVVIPVRRLPVGPPSSIQFQATATILGIDHHEIQALATAGRLKTITSHGELDNPESCFIQITPGDAVFTYGLGLSLVSLIRDPLNAGGRVNLSDMTATETES
ncbi:MAG: pyridoxamine 5'-phosphate oxidase family protein [Actinomycetia bacterium]|nr:pyridoxamine 5'-phosphate oxidase family protein [Actinomycetes bacterium]